ncbi:hypothetical protein NM208_g13436 [Fusarium decemcellulare]|uniref:Uncharacterized protein n=1 Tax=Fusarium decemcellulare TaxID=57161 RepID=A0ACC1RKJ0_9HYPO|nr:hypothetical protein NM208_g13436 [Fusarium decemcellulare]
MYFASQRDMASRNSRASLLSSYFTVPKDSSKATNCRLSPELKTQGGSQHHICPLSCKKNKTRWPVMGTLAIVFADVAAVPVLGDIGVKVKGPRKAFRYAADSRRGLKPDGLKLFYGEFRHNDKLAQDILKREC